MNLITLLNWRLQIVCNCIVKLQRLFNISYLKCNIFWYGFELLYSYKQKYVHVCTCQSVSLYTYMRLKKEKKIHRYLSQYKISCRNETSTNHHGFLSTSIWCLKIFLRVPSTWGSQPNFNFFNVNPQTYQQNCKVHLSNCLETNFYNISNISFRVIRHKNYS